MINIRTILNIISKKKNCQKSIKIYLEATVVVENCKKDAETSRYET